MKAPLGFGRKDLLDWEIRPPKARLGFAPPGAPRNAPPAPFEPVVPAVMLVAAVRPSVLWVPR